MNELEVVFETCLMCIQIMIELNQRVVNTFLTMKLTIFLKSGKSNRRKQSKKISEESMRISGTLSEALCDAPSKTLCGRLIFLFVLPHLAK